MRNTPENRLASNCPTTQCIMACVAIIVGSLLTTEAATKKLRVPPLSDGRSIHTVSATYSFTIPKDIFRYKGILIEARANSRGKQAILLDTHVKRGFQNAKTLVTQEYLKFKTNREKQRIRLNLSNASIHPTSWIPGKTTISFLVQGDEEGLSEINDLIFFYVTDSEGEDVDSTLTETQAFKPRGVYDGKLTAREPFFPEDLDDEQSPIALKPVFPTTGELRQGRPEHAKPERVVRAPNRKRPSLRVKDLGSERDEDNLRRTPQDTLLQTPSNLSDH